MTDQQTSLLGPILLCALGVALFSFMDVLMKGLSLAMGAYSALLWRCAAGSVMGACAMAATRNRRATAGVMHLHIFRALLLGPMAWLFFWSLTQLPLAEAIGLSFVAPIIALALSPLLLGEHVGRNSIIAAVLGMVGVGVILTGRLSGEYDADALLGGLAALASAVLFAGNLLLQRKQAQVAGAIEITFFQNLFVFFMLLPLAPWLLHGGVGGHWPAILASAGLAVASQAVLARAYARAPASRLIPLEYSAFIWAALFGWLVFAERLTVEVIAGVVLIVAACLVAAREKPEIVAHVETDAA